MSKSQSLSFEDMIKQADNLFASSQYHQAIEIYRTLLDSPKHIRIGILEKLGWSCYLIGEYQEALRYFTWYTTLEPQDPTGQTMIGLCALEIGNIPYAKTILSHLVDTTPIAPPEAYTGLIRALIMTKEAFEPYLQAWWERQDINASMAYAIAQTLMETDITHAEAFLEMSLSRFKNDPLLLYGMAICAMKENNLTKAALLCEEVLRYDEKNFPQATLIVILNYIFSEKINEAEALILKASERNWLDNEWHRQLANAWSRTNPSRALKHFWQAIQLTPNDETLWWNYLELLMNQQDSKEFFFACEQAYKQTNNPRFLKIGGAYALSHQDSFTAKKLLSQALKVIKDQETLHLFIMAVFSSDEENPQKIITLASYLSPHDDHPPYAAYAIGKSYLSLGNITQVTLWFSTALHRQPNDPNLLYGMGLIQAEQKNWQEAKNYLIRAHNLIKHPRISYALGLCYLKLKQPEEAIPLFFSYCDAMQNATTCYDIALLLIQDGYKHLATPFLEKAIQCDPSHTQALSYLQLLKPKKE